MPFFDGARGRVFYRNWLADEPAATIVFLHGFGEHSGLYERYAAALNARGISLWALDQIGHGQSDGPRGHVDSMDDLVANAAQLVALASQDHRPITLQGHSLGAAAATVFALREPALFDRLVISGAPLSGSDWMIEAFDAPADATLDLDPADLSSDPDYLHALENDPLAFTEADVLGTLSRTLPTAWTEVAERIASLTIPVLVVHGEEDPVAPYAATLVATEPLPDRHIALFPGAKHDVLNETMHAEVATAIADFVLDHQPHGATDA
ncbi:alpha-beta hydrolase superfamily lysophospholipase [Antricoccus suffuscus]|uniref:Alpha-beta hydrolase superfamily lysophospholipase n=1 Tax=Antricoccus suffuscus TaxID=1629062 RepID=A0A2T1A0T2_9ACTN|nr:alpha/beta fold hydrolase [Antricoccus suffuscus]PRZ42212.1 alpha-beta hydrolase superfamily lysophospholipase [Antricoccus suffuscus]